MPNLEERIAKLEKNQLRFPLDPTSRESVRRSLDKFQILLLKPAETGATNEGSATVLNSTPCIQFADAATKEAYFSLAVQPNAAISSIQFIWSTPATSGNLYWQVDIGSGSELEATNARTTGGTASETAANGVANALAFTEIGAGSGVNFADLVSANEQILGIKFSRLGGDASDTLSNTVNLYGLLITYRLFS